MGARSANGNPQKSSILCIVIWSVRAVINQEKKFELKLVSPFSEQRNIYIFLKSFFGLKFGPHKSGHILFPSYQHYYRSDAIIELHCNDIHNGKSLMDEIRGTINNAVFREILPISALLQNDKYLKYKPDNIEQWLAVPATLKRRYIVNQYIKNKQSDYIAIVISTLNNEHKKY